MDDSYLICRYFLLHVGSGHSMNTGELGCLASGELASESPLSNGVGVGVFRLFGCEELPALSASLPFRLRLLF